MRCYCRVELHVHSIDVIPFMQADRAWQSQLLAVRAADEENVITAQAPCQQHTPGSTASQVDMKELWCIRFSYLYHTV